MCPHQLLDFQDDKPGFIPALRSAVKAYERSILPFAPEILFFSVSVVLHEVVGSFQNSPGGAIISLQLHQDRIRKVRLKPGKYAGLGAAKSIDALIIVANHGDVAVYRGQEPDELILRSVDILVLIDQHILELAGITVQNLLLLLQDADCLHDEIIKVKRVIRAHFFHV